MSLTIQIPDKQILLDLYNNNSVSSIARHFNASSPTVRKWFKQYNIQFKTHLEVSQQANKKRIGIRRKSQSHDFLSNSIILEDLYCNQRQSKQAIANLADCSPTIVNLYIEKYDLEDKKNKYKQAAIDQYLSGLKMSEIDVPNSTLSRWLDEQQIEARNPNSYDRQFNNISSGQQQLADWLSALGLNVKVNDRTSIGIELDIHVIDKKFAVEFNGLYYHSEQFKDRKYHLNKTKIANDNNIALFHVFEDQWKFRQEIVKSMILHRLELTSNIVYARKCQVVEIQPQTRLAFFDVNHIQGKDKASICYGLLYEDKYVAMMSFRKPRFNNNFEWELVRYACKKNYNVVGGFSKLLNYFINNHNSTSIVSYSDNSYATGNVYSKNGFIAEHINRPSYWYVLGDRRIPRTSMTKKMLGRKINIDNLTENQITKQMGLKRIWDCGTIRWAYSDPRH